MNDLRDNLDAKRCLDGATPTTGPAGAGEPLTITNQPGLASIAYRIGTQASFFARLRERLASWALPDGPDSGTRPLAELTADVDDPAVAVLDTWAVAADVTTFYQERIANEMFLGTAGEPRSVLELARLVGERPGPGVAANAFLAFTVETAPGAPLTARVPSGTQVVSIPDQDALPQTFETKEAITARAAWNSLVPRTAEPQDLSSTRELFLVGVDTGLEPGDRLLLIVEESGEVTQAAVTRLLTVETDAAADHTRVTLQNGVVRFELGPGGAADQPLPSTAIDLLALDDPATTGTVRVFALRQQVSFFGHNAPRYGTLPREDFLKDDPFTSADPANNWDQGRTIWTDSRGTPYAGGTSVFLTQQVSDVVPESWAVFVGTPLRSTAGSAASREETAVYRVSGVREASLADYALSADTTGLELVRADGSALGADVATRLPFDVRRTTAFLVSEPLTLAALPITDPFPSTERDGDGACLTLDRRIEGLTPGQALAFRGSLEDGTEASRIVLLRAVDESFVQGSTTLVFQQAVQGQTFVRGSIALNANVARASHGETVEEVLGSGDAGQPAQHFRLQRGPLTFDSAPVPGGVASSLRVRVEGVLWQEVATLHGQGPEAQVYTVEVDGEGAATVRFGDGVDGARLPTGQENISVVYRIGIGPDGEVPAGALSLLTTRPLGIAEVVNPLPAAGAAPPDSVERVKRIAPVTARTLGRIVSLADFEDFALAFAGIGKVRAAALGGVHLTVAGVGGAPVARGSLLFDNLLEAVEAVRLPGPPLRLASYQRVDFVVAAKLVVDPRFSADDVFDSVRETLRTAYAFDRRELAMPLFASEVIGTIQSVAGVVAVDLDALHPSTTSAARPARLDASPARMRGADILPAQLLVIQPDGITLGARTP